MNITITFGTDDKDFSVWSKSDIQNIYALYKLLSKVEEFNVRIVNLGIDIETIKIEVGLGLNNISFHNWNDVKNNTDILIESSAKLNKRQSGYLKRRDCKIVSYRVDNSYITDLEDVTFNNLNSSINNGDYYDEIWILPHHRKTNEHYLKEVYNIPVYILPYIWVDEFMEEYDEFLSGIEKELDYKIHSGPKNITILESNSNILGSSIYPILIVNRVYKEFPNLINKVRVLNTYHLNKNSRFLSIVNNLEIAKNERISFENKYATPFILSTVTDIVISHQWENELDNFYFDVLYGKYPLLHNSETLKGYGFYYDNFNIESASKKIIMFLKNYHLLKDDYANRCTQAIYNYSINNQANINRYKEKIFALLK